MKIGPCDLSSLVKYWRWIVQIAVDWYFTGGRAKSKGCKLRYLLETLPSGKWCVNLSFVLKEKYIVKRHNSTLSGQTMSQNMTNFDSSFESNCIVGCAWLIIIHLVITASIVFNVHILDNVLNHLIYTVSYIMYRLNSHYVYPSFGHLYVHTQPSKISIFGIHIYSTIA